MYADGLLVTALADPPTLERSTSASNASAVRRLLPGAVVILAVLYLTMPFAEATGGRDPWALTKAAVVVVLAVLAAKPWRQLRVGVLALAAALAIVALAVCLVTPPGWFGATRAAAYGLAAATFLAVAAYARSLRRARLIALVVVAAGVAQFVWSFIPWHGGADSSVPMVGTFYWHNQFAAFLLAPALIGGALAIEHRSPWRAAGWVVVPLAVAGVAYSTSRGGEAVLAVGWLLLGVFALRNRARRRGAVLRWLAVGALAVGVTAVISGPPFFATSVSPAAAAQARSVTGGSVDANGHFRLYVWRESISVFEHHPIAGVGYGALEPAAANITPKAWPRSPLSHNDYLQPLVEGGR
jgi:O-antigen ligase